MKRTQNQLNAISYYYTEKRRKENVAKLEELEINHIYNWQTHYKTLTGFINGYGTPIFNQVVEETLDRLQKRYIMLLKTVNCHKETKKATYASIKQCHNYLIKGAK